MTKALGYETHVDQYDEWFDKNPETYQAEIDAIKQLLPAGKGLEIGAGSGRFTGPLKIDTGLEPAKAMRDAALERGIKMVEGVGEALPFEDGSYDFTAFITSTCFLESPLKAYKEAARVTKQNGAIIIAFLEKDSELGKRYEAHKQESPFYCNATFYSYSEITEFLTEAGFSNFNSVQTVLPPSSNKDTNTILPGHDLGTFVVVKAIKN